MVKETQLKRPFFACATLRVNVKKEIRFNKVKRKATHSSKFLESFKS